MINYETMTFIYTFHSHFSPNKEVDSKRNMLNWTLNKKSQTPQTAIDVQYKLNLIVHSRYIWRFTHIIWFYNG